jgi:hypothetical protein
MADESKPSAASENGGDGKSSTDSAHDEHDCKPEKKLGPAKPNKGKKPSLTKTEIVECGSVPFVLWMWAELVRCHDILVLLILGAAITILQIAPCHFIYELAKKWKPALRLMFAGWVLLTLFTWGTVWNNSRRAPIFESEIDEPIRRVFLVFWLSKPVEFEKLCPLNGNLLLYRGGQPWLIDFSFRNVDWAWHSVGGDNKKSAGYNISLKLDDKNLKTQNIVFDNKFSISSICVPVPLSEINENPLKTLHDFNHLDLVVGVSSNVISHLEHVELIINGWGLFHADTKTAKWRDEGNKYTLLAFGGDAAHPPIAGFELNVHKESHAFHPNLSGAFSIDETADFMRITSNQEHWSP